MVDAAPVKLWRYSEHMNLLTNAVESVQVGIEDWQRNTRPRLISAVRNIHAGILLLYKERLRQLSPPDSAEVLVRAKTRPIIAADGSLRHIGVGSRTVDARAIQEHFKSLGIATDWDRYKAIAALRNDIEHYYKDVTMDSLQGLIADAFVLIRDFATSELGEEPLVLFGKDTWQTMLDTNAVYSRERSLCDAAMDEVSWASDTLLGGVFSIRCVECGSDLLAPIEPSEPTEVQLKCRQCGEKEEADSFIPRAIAQATEFQRYLSFDDGLDEPVADCPECFKPTYIDAENRCALCGCSVERECARCSHHIPLSEIESSPLCSYCAHMMSKDD